MLQSKAVSDQFPSLAEFYNGKTVFLTGASGFVGSVLLETLLRCCPGIKSILILLRTKKNVGAESRKDQIFEKKIFVKLKEVNPEFLQKVSVIPGDVCLPNLGMSAENVNLLSEEVSIVFHCAAVINFQKPLEFLLQNNVLGLNSVIELCRKMRKLEALVFTSTAYCNSNYNEIKQKEEVYRLPTHASKFIDAVKNKDKDTLQELMSLCKPDWPNMYCFSKCLAENLIMDTASDLPVAIIRPSIVFCTLEHPFPGYLEEFSGAALISLGIGKGFIKILNMDGNSLLDIVPVDTVAKTHVLAAWSIGTKRCESTLVVNCTASKNLQVKIEDYFVGFIKMSEEFPLPLSFSKTSHFKIVSNKYLYILLTILLHYIPAILLDQLSRISKKRSKMFKVYQLIDKVMNSLKFFTSNTFEFERNNFKFLDKLVCPKDRKNLSIDFEEADISGMIFSLPKGSPFYDWKLDKKSQCERRKKQNRRSTQIRCIQALVLIACFILIYWVVSSLLVYTSVLFLQ